MKTVSTKIDSSLHNRFIEICNEDGKCQSEQLRDLIEDFVNNKPNDENLEINIGDLEEEEPIAKGIIKRVSYDDGQNWIDIHELENVTVSD